MFNKRPVEIEITNPSAEQYFGVAGTDIIVPLDELHPGDPGQRSGLSLRIMEKGQHCSISVHVDGSHHCVGIIDGAILQSHLGNALSQGPANRSIPLFELYPQIEPLRPSGATLQYEYDREDKTPSLAVYMGTHCFGMICGSLVDRFFACLRVRQVVQPIESPTLIKGDIQEYTDRTPMPRFVVGQEFSVAH